jgi:hypothetical protein
MFAVVMSYRYCLLRTCGDRPRRRRTAKKRHELAPP